MFEVKTRVIHDTSGLFSQGDVTDRPCPAITIGVGGLNSSHYQVEYFMTDAPEQSAIRLQDKPPYYVPSMAEIEALPWNGFNAISTFSGAGGSCLGYRMAGFRVLWASEFIPAAQEVYRLNHPDTILDTRDIRQVQPQDILDAIGMQAGELDLMDGSPPCASFSTAGKREKGWGQVKAYSDTKQRTDDLFFEFARLVKGIQPKVFIAENVSGLVKGTAKGYFKEILQALKDCGYTVRAKLLDAQWLGVPQMRQRVIFQGVRSDLGLEPVYPKPLAYQYSVRDALPWIVRQGDNGGFGSGGMQEAIVPDGTIGTGPQTGNGNYPPSVVEAATDISRFAIGDEWDWLAPGGQSKKYYQLTRAPLDGPSGTITQRGGDNTVASVTHPTEKRKFSIAELKRICAFPDDFQLTGSYAQQWERLGRAVPPVMMRYIAEAVRDGVLAQCVE